MTSPTNSLFQNKWVDLNDDGNSIVTANKDGQKVILTTFTDSAGNLVNCERVCNVVLKNEKVLKRSLQRLNNWKKFGLESLDLDNEYTRYKTISFRSDELIMPGVVQGSAAYSNDDYTALAELEVPQPSRLLMNELSKLMNAILGNQIQPNLISAAPKSELEGSMVEEYNKNAMRYADDERTIRVSELPEYVTEADIYKLFNRAGDIKRLHLVTNRETNTSRGLVFITYHDVHDAQRAINMFNDVGICGVVAKVQWSTSSRQHASRQRA